MFSCGCSWKVIRFGVALPRCGRSNSQWVTGLSVTTTRVVRSARRLPVTRWNGTPDQRQLSICAVTPAKVSTSLPSGGW
ncbi:hypothetical protein D9M71_760830 [compost metagenome]